MSATERPLDATVRMQDRAAVIDLRGEINTFSEVALNDAYQRALSESPVAILLNFREVGYINSTGIALIVNLLAQSRKAGVPVLVYNLSDHYVEIFKITRLTDYMSIHPDEASALASVVDRAK